MRKLKPSQTWVNRWEVESSTGDATYTVAQKADGSWGCGCPRWRFSKADSSGRRPDCKHIVAVQRNEPVATVEQLLANQQFRNVPPALPETIAAPIFLLQTKRKIVLVD